MPVKKYYHDIDLRKRKLIRAALDPVSTMPTNPVVGQVCVYNGQLMYYNGSSWATAGGLGSFRGTFDAGGISLPADAGQGDWWFVDAPGDIGGLLDDSTDEDADEDADTDVEETGGALKIGDIIIAIEANSTSLEDWSFVRMPWGTGFNLAYWEDKDNEHIQPKEGKGVYLFENFKVDDQGRVYIEDIHEEGFIPKNVLVFPGGRIATIDQFVTYNVVFNLQFRGGSPSPAVSGIAIIASGAIQRTVSISGSQVVFPEIPDGTFSYIIIPASHHGYKQIEGSVTVDGEGIEQNLALTPDYGEPGDNLWNVKINVAKPEGHPATPVEGQAFLVVDGQSIQKSLFCPSGETVSYALWEGIPDGEYRCYIYPSAFPPTTGVVTVANDHVEMTITAGDFALPETEITTDAGTEKDLTVSDRIILSRAAGAGNVEYTLPSTSTAGTQPYVIRKDNVTAYAITITTGSASGSPYIYYNGNSSHGITTDKAGAWVMLQFDGTDWHVLMDSGNWGVTAS